MYIMHYLWKMCLLGIPNFFNYLNDYQLYFLNSFFVTTDHSKVIRCDRKSKWHKSFLTWFSPHLLHGVSLICHNSGWITITNPLQRDPLDLYCELLSTCVVRSLQLEMIFNTWTPSKILDQKIVDWFISQRTLT